MRRMLEVDIQFGQVGRERDPKSAPLLLRELVPVVGRGLGGMWERKSDREEAEDAGE